MPKVREKEKSREGDGDKQNDRQNNANTVYKAITFVSQAKLFTKNFL